MKRHEKLVAVTHGYNFKKNKKGVKLYLCLIKMRDRITISHFCV